MKNWKETADVLERVAQLAHDGQGSAIATVIDISGSAYRRPGAKLLVSERGDSMGGVSGGCLEADVREIARGVIRTGAPRLLHYDTGADDQTVWGLGLGCFGSVDIFVQSAATPSRAVVLERVRGLLSRDDPFAVATLVAGSGEVGRSVAVSVRGLEAAAHGDELDRAMGRAAGAALTGGASTITDLDQGRVFTDVLLPPVPLIVCGAGDDARPLVGFAAACGFAVTVVDHREAYLSRERFPDARQLVTLRAGERPDALHVDRRTLVVVQTHSLEHDREWLRRFLQTDVCYIGLLGPRARRDRVLGQLGAVDANRVFGPVGLDLGADGPEQVAISVIAELLAVRTGREPAHLRDRGAAIHAG